LVPAVLLDPKGFKAAQAPQVLEVVPDLLDPLDLPDQEDLVETVALVVDPALLDLKARPVLLDQADLEAFLEDLEDLGLTVPQDPSDQTVVLVVKVVPEDLAPPDHLVHKVYPEVSDPVVDPERLVMQEQEDSLEILDLLVPSAHLDRVVPVEILDLVDLLDSQEGLAHKVDLVPLDRQDR
jgi:hypothetical protein